MADIQDSWKELASKAESLGLKLKLHLEQDSTPEDGDGGFSDLADNASASGSRDPKALAEEAARKVQEAFDSLGSAAKDPAVHADAKDLGKLFKDAIMTTVGAVGSEVASKTSAARDVLDGTVDPITGPRDITAPGPIDVDIEVVETHSLNADEAPTDEV